MAATQGRSSGSRKRWPSSAVSDPCVISDADLQAQFEFGEMVRDKVTEANREVIMVRNVKAQLEDRMARSNDARLAEARSKTLALEEELSNDQPLKDKTKTAGTTRRASMISLTPGGKMDTSVPEKSEPLMQAFVRSAEPKSEASRGILSAPRIQ